MGSDKAFLELAGRPLLAYSLDLARSVATEVKIVGDPDKFASFGAVIADVYSDRGPLGGIHAYLHPLCAVYRKQFCVSAERALSNGKNKVDALFSGVLTRVISEEELARAGFDASIFRNLNTHEEWEREKQEFAV